MGDDRDGVGDAFAIGAGGFHSAGDVVSPRLAMWDGSGWHRFPGPAPGIINTMRVFNGDLIVAGSFDRIAGVTVNSIARWDGVRWHPLAQGLLYFDDVGVPRAARVYTLAEYNGELIAAGGMGAYSPSHTMTPGGIARWNGVQWNGLGSGLVDVTWNAVTGLTVDDGELVASAHHRCATETVGEIARWDGNVWTSMEGLGAQDVASLGGDLHALLLDVDCGASGWEGTTFAFARWEQVFWNALSAPGAAGNKQLSTLSTHITLGTSLWDGTTWTVLGGGVNGSVQQAIEYKGALYFGGDFTTAGGLPSLYISRWGGTPTEVTVENLQGWAKGGLVNLRWRLSLDGDRTEERVRIRRAANKAGPYEELASLHAELDMAYVDSAVEPGRPYWYQIVLVGDRGAERIAATIRIDVPTGAVANTVLHRVSSLRSGPIEIRYRIGPHAVHVRLDVYDVRGRHIQTLAQGTAQPGEYVRTWDRRIRGSLISRGLFFVRLKAGATTLVHKTVIVNE